MCKPLCGRYLLSPDTASQRVGALGCGNLATNPKYRVTLVDSGCLEPLMSLARSDEVRGGLCGVFGCGWMRTRKWNYAYSDAAECIFGCGRMRIRKRGLMHILVRQVELEIQRYAVLALANIGSTVANHAAMVEEGTLPLLISLSNHVDEEIRQYAAYALVKIGHNSEVRAERALPLAFTNAYLYL